ncbi:PfkB family carbohydrate kinase [Cellulomonas sp. ACRRI]|uniref:PfkB family carbohydrate kinase n=1 Tax=Cellulomonas sp. ACRRI TaxID=2918188 RepID=UPI001EF32002|nr:PfkB family carbohydrate kinase [Cellulomonas sp. ACRRI]MCG7287296.1 PfkB family carbohydrate kinase [Cellulomonas sp. ACRRI]
MGAGAGGVRVVVVGQVGRDLVLTVDGVPDAGGSADVRGRSELLGGKGANQARACRQLGAAAALVGVVGDDPAGRLVLDEARAATLDVGGVVVRAAARTALLVDVVGPPGERRLLEHVEPSVLLTPADVEASAERLRAADAVLLQLQQPADAVRAALRLLAPRPSGPGEDEGPRGAPGGRPPDSAGPLLVADGAGDDAALVAELLAAGAVLRADAEEAATLAGRPVRGVDDALAAAADLVGRGARAVRLAAGPEGDVVAWPGGHVVTPLLGDDPADPTGAGDASTAALAVALATGRSPAEAAWWAAVAARRTVGHPGGRPDLDPGTLAAEAAEAAGRA